MRKIINMKCEIEAATWLNLKCDDRVGPFRTGALWELKLIAGDPSLADTLLDEMECFVNSHNNLLEALEGAIITLEQVCEGQHEDNVCCHHLRMAKAVVAKARGEWP